MAPFFDSRKLLPPVFAPLSSLPRVLQEQIRAMAEQDGDTPDDVLADAIALMCDEADGAVFDPRELGFADEPWVPPSAAPDPARGQPPAPQAPPDGGPNEGASS